MNSSQLRGTIVAMSLLVFAVSCARDKPQPLATEQAASPVNQEPHMAFGKVAGDPVTNRNNGVNTISNESLLQRVTNAPSSSQKTLTEVEIVEIIRLSILRVNPSAKFEMNPPRFSAGKWTVLVYFLPFGSGRDVLYTVSPEGKIIDRRAGY